jgi:hypothetical protein
LQQISGFDFYPSTHHRNEQTKRRNSKHVHDNAIQSRSRRGLHVRI